jgi:hypothetical protein
MCSISNAACLNSRETAHEDAACAAAVWRRSQRLQLDLLEPTRVDIVDEAADVVLDGDEWVTLDA